MTSRSPPWDRSDWIIPNLRDVLSLHRASSHHNRKLYVIAGSDNGFPTPLETTLNEVEHKGGPDRSVGEESALALA